MLVDGAVHRRGLRRCHRATASRFLDELELTAREAKIADAGAEGDPGPAGLPARRRPRLPHLDRAGRHAVRRRGPAHPAGHPDRLRPVGRALRPRRAVHRPAPARQPPADRDPGPAARPRQHPDRRRARRGHHPRGRLDRRHRPGRRRARRRGRALRAAARTCSTNERLDHRRLPLRPPGDRAAAEAPARCDKNRKLTVVGRAREQPAGRRRRASRSGCSSPSPASAAPASPRWSTTSSTRSSPTSSTAPGRCPGGTSASPASSTSTRSSHVDQSPIGRTPRSNPATYTGVFDRIRTLFAETHEAKVRGYQPGRFSFNVKGGRCEDCSGDGTIKIEMNFLPDVYVPCEVCDGARYNRETLEVHYKGKNIAEVLDMPIEEAADFFEPSPAIDRYLEDARRRRPRLRAARPAARRRSPAARRSASSSRPSCRSGPPAARIYVLDEPTTGLHFEDVRKLLGVLHGLVDKGNTVIVIEHNLDVIKTADWIIDLGPEGGSGGGRSWRRAPRRRWRRTRPARTGRYPGRGAVSAGAPDAADGPGPRSCWTSTARSWTPPGPSPAGRHDPGRAGPARAGSERLRTLVGPPLREGLRSLDGWTRRTCRSSSGSTGPATGPTGWPPASSTGHPQGTGGPGPRPRPGGGHVQAGLHGPPSCWGPGSGTPTSSPICRLQRRRYRTHPALQHQSAGHVRGPRRRRIDEDRPPHAVMEWGTATSTSTGRAPRPARRRGVWGFGDRAELTAAGAHAAVAERHGSAGPVPAAVTDRAVRH